MSPKDNKLHYFFHEPKSKLKIQPEYLVYSEVDNSYGELLADSDIPLDEPLQNEAQHTRLKDISETMMPLDIPYVDSIMIPRHTVDTKVKDDVVDVKEID